jgi:hypothetical protein
MLPPIKHFYIKVKPVGRSIFYVLILVAKNIQSSSADECELVSVCSLLLQVDLSELASFSTCGAYTALFVNTSRSLATLPSSPKKVKIFG